MENIQPQRRCYYKIFPLEAWSLALKIPKGLTRWHSQTAPGSHYASCGKKLKELLPDCRDHRTVFEMDSSFSASKENTPGALKSTTFASPWPSGIKRRCWKNELTLTQWKLELNWNDPLPENTQALWLDCRQNLSSLKYISISRRVEFTQECVTYKVAWQRGNNVCCSTLLKRDVYQ